MTQWEFPASEPVDLQVQVPAGSITVLAAATQTATVTIDGNRGSDEGFATSTRVEFDPPTLSIAAPHRAMLGRDASLDVTVELPEGSSCRVRAASADVRCSGELAAADIHTASGDVRVENVSGLADVDTASGDVLLDAAGEARAKSASGDVTIGRVSGPVSVSTASGDVQIDQAAGPKTDVKSASGDIRVAVAPGIGVYQDLSSLSGTVSSELEPAEDSGGSGMTLHCRTISGDVRVSRAAQAAAR
jgi:DUF4097 and DUF4098 domain-containing protein YvlB